MEPPESPSKPRRPKSDSDSDAEKPKKPAVKKTPAADEAKAEAKPAAKPRATSKTSEAAGAERPAAPKAAPMPPPPAPKPPVPAVPVMSTTAPVVEPVVMPQAGITSASTPKSADMAVPRPVTPPARTPVVMPGATKASGGQALSTLRTFLVRNIEVLRNFIRNFGPSVRKAFQSVGNTKIGSKTLGDYWQSFKTWSGKFWINVDRQLMKLQTELEQSDTAVIVYTLIAIFACVALTLIAQRLWHTY